MDVMGEWSLDESMAVSLSARMSVTRREGEGDQLPRLLRILATSAAKRGPHQLFDQ